jgi:hypothetical protein
MVFQSGLFVILASSRFVAETDSLHSQQEKTIIKLVFPHLDNANSISMCSISHGKTTAILEIALQDQTFKSYRRYLKSDNLTEAMFILSKRALALSRHWHNSASTCDVFTDVIPLHSLFFRTMQNSISIVSHPYWWLKRRRTKYSIQYRVLSASSFPPLSLSTSISVVR